MLRRSLVLISLLSALALPLSASQFVDLPFDQIARESALIVRGTVEHTWTAWDDSREIIFTYASVRVDRFFGEVAGPDVLIVREVGGTLDGYTQEAVGFPAIRQGERVVLMLSRWEDSQDYRIHAFNQGKFLVQKRAGVDVLVSDPVRQGEARLRSNDPFRPAADAAFDGPALTMEEFSSMVEDARAGIRFNGAAHRQ
jgi:hypothetical protein